MATKQYIDLPDLQVYHNGIKNEIAGLYENLGYNGSKNMLNTDSLSTQTVNGVTFTISRDSDGYLKSIKVNGTATADITVNVGKMAGDFNGFVTLSGCPSGGSSSTYYLMIYSGTIFEMESACDYGTGSLFQYPDDNTNVDIIVKNGTTMSNKYFYPMVREYHDTSTMYSPRYLTNKELTTEVNTIKSEFDRQGLSVINGQLCMTYNVE